jgi:hypothetical protein
LRVEDKVASSTESYYSRLTSSIIAESGIEVAMPLEIAVTQLPTTIGSTDASNDDVIAALVGGAMGPIGSFLGPRLGSGKHTLLTLSGKADDANVEITFELIESSITPPSVVSTPPGACASQVGALRCRVPAGVSQIKIRHGDWRKIYHVDRIRLQLIL